MGEKRQLTRRDFLRLSAAAATGAVVAACAPTTPVVVEREVIKEVPVEKAVVVEKEVPKEIVKEVPVEVEKQVEVVKEVVKEVEVEKQVIVTATPMPAIVGDLKIWTFPMTENDRDLLWSPLMERFNEQFPGIKANIEILPWGGRREKMLTAFAAGEPPDIAYVNTDTISLFGRNDVLAPLDDVIPHEVWEDLPERCLVGVSWEGKRVMYPLLFIVAGKVANKALLEEVGWDPEEPPVHWDDWRELGALAKEKDYFLTGFSTLEMGNCGWIELVWQAGGECLDPDATKSLIDSEAGIEAMTYESQMFVNGWVPKEGAVGSEEEAAPGIDYFLQGKQVISGSGYPPLVRDVQRQAPDMELVLVPTKEYKKQVRDAGSGCWGIFKGIASAAAAAEWVNWMIRPENMGFESSVHGEPPARMSAMKYWTVEPAMKQFMELHLPNLQMNQDTNNWWQLRKVTLAPYRQAAALGLMPPEEAVTKAAADITAAIQEELAKQ